MLNDVLAPGLKLVVCGTAAGEVSAARREYYAGPGNKFWSVLFEIGLTPRRLASHEYMKLLTFGIGLTDVAKDQSGSDASIDFGLADIESLKKKVHRFAPAIFAFNGKKAAQVFLGQRHVELGLQSAQVETTRLFVAPSTSGAANGYWNADVWHELAKLTRELAT